MKQIAEVIKNPEEVITKESSATLRTELKLPDKLTLRLFTRFVNIYGMKFTDKFDSDEELGIALDEWSEALRGYTGLQIKKGIEGCRSKHAWPPEISEFIAQARGSHITGAYRDFEKDNYKKGDKDIAQKHVDLIRQSLNTFYKGDE